MGATSFSGSPMDLNVFFKSKTNSSMLVSPPAINQEYTNTTESESDAESKVLPENDVAPWLLAHCSVIVFLTGIILARFGLWIVDLTVNQLLQEKVEEEVRGVVNGVQESLNNSLDLAKCILVILLPAEEKEKMLEKGEEERAVVVKKTEKRKKGEVCSV